MTFVPAGFVPPRAFATAEFVLAPLGPEHNEADHAAWTSSIDHVRRTPGFPLRDGWPPQDGMGLDANLADLRKHAEDFGKHRGFTFTVLDAEDAADVIGCVYVYPAEGDATVAHARSWVRADRADMDLPLRHAVHEWLRSEWCFGTIRYDGL
ncbi:N-acetyltransferase [Allosaccharopolyspora coralli]|uniref:N-acetyltransferase n=1 Tax=Allosaccharopolyspora coralli TaxID=2665642 RepID=A0A5Q3Q8Y4_9PSEU|nr:N-acetyltransferase [Allosaccharopolyspora coralli]QGK71008.1 N-acetyltransferase [Allosaccharopolyspora coralli]